MTITPGTRELIIRYREAHCRMKAAMEELQEAEKRQSGGDEIREKLAGAKHRAHEDVLMLVAELERARSKNLVASV